MTVPDSPGSPEQNAEYVLDLICCGRDDGRLMFSTWEAADEFRNSYIDAEGHDRAAIISSAAELGPVRGAPAAEEHIVRAKDIPGTKAWAEIKASRPNTPERKAAYDKALAELAQEVAPGWIDDGDHYLGESGKTSSKIGT